MPFTPFHFGPALLFAALFGYLDFLTFMITNVLVDFEPLLVLSFDLDLRYGYPIHGFAHTLIGGSLVALALAEVMAKFYKHLGREMDIRKLRITALSGVWLHIVLDSFLYTDIKPLFPLSWNPFYGVFSAFEVYRFCILAFGLTISIYIIRKVNKSLK